MSMVFRRKRKHGGRTVSSKTFYARIDGKVVNLQATDKQVAEQKAATLRRDREREGVGLIAPKPMRLAASRRLLELVEDYIKDRTTLGRSEGHISHLEGRLGRLVRECGWSVVGDITADSFQAWRGKQRASPKTLNEYLSAAGAFCHRPMKMGNSATKPEKPGMPIDTRPAMMKPTPASGMTENMPPSWGSSRVCARS